MKSRMTVVIAAASSLTLLVMLLAVMSADVAVAAPPVPDVPSSATITSTQSAPLDLFAMLRRPRPCPPASGSTMNRR